MHFTLPTLAALVAVSCALPTVPSYNHVVHEKRDKLPEKWAKRSKLDSSAVLPVRVGLKQRNLDRADDYLNRVSNLDSKYYGKHWSIGEITKTFAPSEETTKAVLQWLSEHGISTPRKTGALHTLEFDLSVEEAERLLKTEYFVYEHGETGAAHIACEEYSVPAHISEHVNIITPTLHFDVKPQQAIKKRDVINPADPEHGYHPYHEDPASSEVRPTSGADGNSTNIQDCVDHITPDCLRALYNIPQASSSPQQGNSFGINEYTPNTYTADDLDQFFGNYTPKAVGARPDFVSVHGGILDNDDPTDYNLHGESNLDLQYAMALTYPQTITLYERGDDKMDASDASFIQTKVVSTSWGYQESDLTSKYMQTLCNEYMKLGLQGISVLFSTADNGVGGNSQTCPDGVFQPDFPASCPYVTAVGATQIDSTITDLQSVLSSNSQPEIAINSQVKSGGGFSNVFAMPDYQSPVVSNYLKSSPPPYTSDQFNNSGNARAIPDISANGHSYQVVVGGTVQSVDGTSASAPLLASMITLINDARLAVGKSTLGFLNPAIYKYADRFIKDVTVGNNPGCDTNGFDAVEGWDPVTGLGTPEFGAMMNAFMAL